MFATLAAYYTLANSGNGIYMNRGYMNKTELFTGTMTSSCTCAVYDETIGEFTNEPAPECYGNCWEWALDDFATVIQELRDNAETNWWRVENLKLWDRQVSGMFYAKTVEEMLRGMTVNGEWYMRYTVFSDHIEYSLSHHDAPMGSSSVLRAVTDEQREEWGLY